MKRLKPFLLFILIQFIFISQSFSQEDYPLHFERFSVEYNKLASNEIHSIYEDKLGHILIGSTEGLDKFKGHLFESLKLDFPGLDSLTYFYITDIKQDDSNNLWLGTRHCLFTLNLKTGKVHKIPLCKSIEKKEKKAPVGEHRIRNIKVLSDNTVLVTKFLNHGLFIVKDFGDSILNIPIINPEYSEKKLEILDMFIDDNDLVYLGLKKNGYCIYNPKTQKLTFPELPKELSSLSVGRLFKDSKNRIWLGTLKKGLYRYSSSDRAVEHYYSESPAENKRLANNRINDIVEDNYNQIWVATEYGLHKIFYNKSSDEPITNITNYLNDNNNPQSIVGNNISHIYFDSNQILWVSVGRKGLCKANPKENNFIFKKIIKHDPETKNTTVSCTYRDGEELWLGTNLDGLQKYNIEMDSVYFGVENPAYDSLFYKGRVTGIQEYDNRIMIIAFSNEGIFLYDKTKDSLIHLSLDGPPSRELLSNRVFTIFLDSYDRLWIAYLSYNSISIYDFSTQKIEHIQWNDDVLPIKDNSYRVNQFFQDSKKQLWIATRNGLYRFNNDGTSKLFRPKQFYNKRFWVNDCYEFGDNGLFFSTLFNGLYKLDADSLSFIVGFRNPKVQKAEDYSVIHSMFLDNYGNFWISVANLGIIKYSDETKKQIIFNIEKGLIHKNIYRIEQYHNNLIYFSIKGISIFDLKDYSFINYATEDKFKINYSSRNSFIFEENNFGILGTQNGILIINPYEKLNRTSDNKPIIEHLKILNKQILVGEKNRLNVPYLANTIQFNPSLYLTYKDVVFTIHYLLPDYINPLKNQYAYMMEGLDNSWKYVGNQTFATFSYLTPGDYTFKVKAANSYGQWTEPTSIKIYIKPAFYQTLFFKLMLTVLLIVLVYIYIKYRMTLIKNRNALLEKHNQELKVEVENRRIAELEAKRLSIGIEQSVDSVVITDLHGNIEYHNSAFSKLLGHPNRDYREKNILDFLQYENRNLLKTKKDFYAISIELSDSKLSFTKKNGDIITIIQSISHIRNNENVIMQYVITIRDITGIDQMEKELEISRKMTAIGTLASGIAHDLNNIIASIRLNADLVSSSNNLDSESLLDIEEIVKSSDKAKEIISQILNYSRIEREKTGKVNIGNTFESNSRMIRSMIPQRIDLKIDISPDLIINGNETKFYQIIINLISNAVDAIQGSGKLTITACKRWITPKNRHKYNFTDTGHWIELKFSDTGKGISKQNLSRIFDPFFTTKDVGKGTGMGLSIIKSVVNSYNGILYVDSKESEGTNFILLFPDKY